MSAVQHPSSCPKCGYVRALSDTVSSTECPRCGIIYAKYLQYLAEKDALAAQISNAEPIPDVRQKVADYLFRLPSDPNRGETIGYAALYGVFLFWGLRLISYDYIDGDIGTSFLHRVNLPFHEFGHVLFRPLLLCGVFLFKERKPFSATFCLWWAGENLLDVAPYIGDARSMSMPLTGEWNEGMEAFRALRHDWHNILEPLGLLAWDHRLAATAHALGALVMGLAWLWGGYWLWLNWRAAKP
jgi:hypothetical protein